MMRLPWKRVARTDGGPVTVSATELRLRRYRDVPALVIDTFRLRSSFAAAEGALEVGLAAAPLRRTFWTLTTWREPEAVDRYYRDREHASMMRRYRGRLEHARSARWTADDPRPAWTAALAMLDSSPAGRRPA